MRRVRPKWLARTRVRKLGLLARLDLKLRVRRQGEWRASALLGRGGRELQGRGAYVAPLRGAPLDANTTAESPPRRR